MSSLIYHGNCLQVMAEMEANSFTAIVTDPPYGLKFMAKEWDHGVPGIPFWEAALRVLKPGGHILAFGGTRTFHRLACAIEDAGFEVRDTLMWAHGSGFPKSLDVSKALDKAAGAEREVVGRRIPPPDSDFWKKGFDLEDVVRHTGAATGGLYGKGLRCGLGSPITTGATLAAQEWNGYGTGLKPAWEPIILARKPLEGTVIHNVQKHGTGALNIDGCRVGDNPGYKYNADHNGNSFHGEQGNRIKPTAAKAGRATIESTKGRWPANLIHDGSEEVLEHFPEAAGQLAAASSDPDSPRTRQIYGKLERSDEPMQPRFDTGSAARFFYTAKATTQERAGSKHPTVKPLELMQYLVRLVKQPKGNMILDPFMGSGTTLIAAGKEGIDAVGIELDGSYVADAIHRIKEADPLFADVSLIRRRTRIEVQADTDQD